MQDSERCLKCEQSFPEEAFRTGAFSFSRYCWQCRQQAKAEEVDIPRVHLRRCLRCADLFTDRQFLNAKGQRFDWCRACRLQHILDSKRH